jgi:hypothetical protein
MKDQLLSGGRTIVRDLIKKRLWPVAIALVVALVAVPVFLGSSGSAVPSAPPATVAPAAPEAVAGPDQAISVTTPAVLGTSRPGPVDDPFFDPKARGVGATSTSSSTSTSTSTSTPTSAPTSAPTSTSTSKPDTPAVAPSAPSTSVDPPAATPSGAHVYRTRVRWGADDTAKVRGISRLEPLGGKVNPALLYLGTTEDHSRAVFLLGPNALADGDAACGEKTCRVIGLKAGQSVDVGVVGIDGAPARKFSLTVDAIRKIAVESKDAALALRARVDADGRTVLRAMIQDPKTAAAIGQFGYALSIGAVVGITAP